MYAELIFTLALMNFGGNSDRSIQLRGMLIKRADNESSRLASTQDDQTQDIACRELLVFLLIYYNYTCSCFCVFFNTHNVAP